LRLAWGKQFAIPQSPKINRAKWTGGMAPSGRVPTLQAQGLEFKLQFHPLKKKMDTQIRRKIYSIVLMLTSGERLNTLPLPDNLCIHSLVLFVLFM
jgi:hypothetical protein